MNTLVDEAKRWQIEIDRTTLNFIAAGRINHHMENLQKSPDSIQILQNITELFEICRQLGLDLNSWQAQNIYFSIGKKNYSKKHLIADTGSSQEKIWVEYFDRLGAFLQVKSPDLI